MEREEAIPFDRVGSDDVLVANLAALARTNPGLAGRVRSAEIEGLTFFRSKKGPLSCRAGDDFLVSRYDPAGEMEGVVARAIADGPDILMVLGTGLGYHLDGLAKRYAGRVVCYDPDVRMIRAALSRVDLSAHLGTERFILADRVEEIHINHEIDASTNLRFSARTVVLGSYKRLHPDAIDRFRHRMDMIQRDKDVTLTTYIMRSREWFRDLLASFHRVYPLATVEALRGRFRDMPAIVIASGPSLDKNVELLREAQGRAVLISVGTPMKKLASLGIAPDIAVGIEANDIRYQFDGVDRLNEVTLVLSLKAHPGLFDLDSARTVVFSEPEVDQTWALDRMGKPRAFIKNGGSVANTAFAIAHLMGVSDLVLVGQDLAFGEGGTSHAGGTGTGTDRETYRESIPFEPEHRAELNRLGFELVDGYNGGLVGTRFHWLNYLLWFERRVVEYRDDGIRFINATEGGAKIHGMEQMPLRRVIDGVLPVSLPEPPKARLARLCADPPARPLPDLLDLLREDLRNLKKTRRLAGACSALSRKIFDALNEGTVSDQKINQMLRKLRRAEAPLSALSSKVDPIISPFTRNEVVIANHIQTTQPDGDLNERSRLRLNINQSHMLQEGVCKAAEEVGHLLEEVIERLETMYDETNVKNPSLPHAAGESLAPPATGAGVA